MDQEPVKTVYRRQLDQTINEQHISSAT